MRPAVLAWLLAVSSPAISIAQTAPVVDAGPITDAAAVVVTGVQPGPGMWRVSKGEHVMWVLATQSPLPKTMHWLPRDVDAVLGEAQEVIWAPSVVVNADVGFFGKLALVPSLIGVRKPPDGKTLREAMPAEMYARWQSLKLKYLGRAGSVETWRPLFAAMELYQKAVEKSGLAFGGIVEPVIAEAVKTRKLKETAPTVKVTVDEPRAAIKEFRSSALDDLACFDKTLRRLETDIDAMTVRANAWAIGDLETLRSLPVIDNNRTCMMVAMQSSVVQKQGGVDIEPRLERAWLDAAESALARNRVTFALLSMPEVLRPDGYLAKLQAKGYAVEAP